MLDRLIIELQKAGLTESQIAAETGLSQPTINRIKHGLQTPGYVAGKRLEKLHAERCTPESSAA